MGDAIDIMVVLQKASFYAGYRAPDLMGVVGMQRCTYRQFEISGVAARKERNKPQNEILVSSGSRHASCGEDKDS